MPDTEIIAANYDEAKVPQYTLPDPLTMEDGTPVTSARDWIEKRRSEVLELFREQFFCFITHSHLRKYPIDPQIKNESNRGTFLSLLTLHIKRSSQDVRSG